MRSNSLARINAISRLTLAFVFFYHGLVPKILWISPVEAAMTNAHQLDSAVFSPIAGVLEILLALAIVFFRRSLVPVYIAGIALIALLVDVMIVMPALLFEAFNPVTINIASIALACIACVTHPFAETEAER